MIREPHPFSVHCVPQNDPLCEALHASCLPPCKLHALFPSQQSMNLGVDSSEARLGGRRDIQQLDDCSSVLDNHHTCAESAPVVPCQSASPRAADVASEEAVCKRCDGFLREGMRDEKKFCSSSVFDHSCVSLLCTCVLSVAAGFEMSPRERIQSHRLQVAGKVQIPDIWGGEDRLLEWVSTEDVEEALRPPDLLKARAALVSARSSTIVPSAGTSTFRVIRLDSAQVSLS